MESIGICMGSSNIKVVEIAKDKNKDLKIKSYCSKPHEGNAKKILTKILGEFDFNRRKKFAVTGRKFKNFVKLPSISEPEATEIAYNRLKNKYDDIEAIVSAGGETFMVYELDKKGKIADVYSGNKCASGTGEFFLQQLKRMDLKLSKALKLAKVDNPYHVSGRCSVFCKSDCTHALNKGEDKGRIVAGLCSMMADKIMELLSNFNPDNIMIIGGTAQNDVMIDYLKRRIKKVIVPQEADYFEALGTALWSEKNGYNLNEENIYDQEKSSFDYLPSLKKYKKMVTFHDIERGQIKDRDKCILGIDVGSTTTKAAIVRWEDNALLASVYLRTNGDPVAAARKCYRRLLDKTGSNDIKINGLGVTGSGRQIVGLHALTDSIHNEIMAHATAAVYFDEEVDTIFEIGGQDAKYTYIINQVPTDYAMNEACSAGTGSFLEEAAKESFNIKMTELENIALNGNNPPNFNDQCSAFISSDIKSAIQEGIEVEDICAGLVYSICLNYTNRVKGNRPVGEKVFMQGGVCYNRAVPMAMAALTDKKIIVPPEPGLMGAYGVALMVKEHIKLGLTEKNEFNLKDLYNREITYKEPFICQGGKENCDRQCEINVMEIEDKKYFFGGACNKYVNLSHDLKYDVGKLNLVKKREKMVFEDYFASPDKDKCKGKIGINRSLTVSSLLPLYSKFFAELGYKVILPEVVREEGIQQESAAFCHPIEISHGYMYDLLNNFDYDYIFLPHVKGLYVKNGAEESMLCPMAQGEPYYLSAVWSELKRDNIFSPVLSFKNGFEDQEDKFVKVAKKLNVLEKESKEAYKKAVRNQRLFNKELKNKGKEVLSYLEENPEKKAIILFGRPYNAFVSEANMGIPHKFATRGELIVPYDMLPIESKDISNKMYWSMGQMIMKGAVFVSENPDLFGAYITNFSCGPDSFLINYFRDENGSKPSLTLELDSHTADAGLNTRIEAFLDVVDSYRKLQKNEAMPVKERNNFKIAKIEYGKNVSIIDSSENRYSLTDENVKLLIPSMGGMSSKAFTTAFRYCGINAVTCPPPGKEELKRGRANSTSKECLPLQLTLGSLLKYLEERENEDEILVYFMPEASGPCRFGQYNVLMNNLIKEKEIEDVVLLTLSADNSYAGMGLKFTIRAWQAVIISEVMEDIYSTIITLAKDKSKALNIFNKSKQKIFQILKRFSWSKIKTNLKKEVAKLSEIELKESYENAKKVLLTGEIYVRSDQFSRRFLVEKMAKKDIVTKVAAKDEWLYYIDYLLQNGINNPEVNFIEKCKNKVKDFFQKKYEKTIKDIFSECGLCEYHQQDINDVIEDAKGVISPQLTGEAILTIGGTIEEIINNVDGVIIIGPFGCMPHRVAESILDRSLETAKRRISGNEKVQQILQRFSSLPFLAIEVDGSVFTQVIEARLESFCLQVRRLNKYRDSLEI